MAWCARISVFSGTHGAAEAEAKAGPMRHYLKFGGVVCEWEPMPAGDVTRKEAIHAKGKELRGNCDSP